MGKTLGLDLGTHSIGWAIIDDETSKVIGLGARIFSTPINKINVSVNVPNKVNRWYTHLTQFKCKIYRSISGNIVLWIMIPLLIITTLLAFVNWNNWQFWLNLSLTIAIALLTVIHSHKK